LQAKKTLRKNPQETDAETEVEHYESQLTKLESQLTKLEADKEWLKKRIEEQEKKRGIL
jgi:predicted RNase H-like nuclease (RuvC/YqgF family)